MGSLTKCELQRLLPYLTGPERVQLDRLLRPVLGMETWARRYLPAYFTRPASRLHHWLANRLQNLHVRRGTQLALIAPRGSAKSTWASLAYPLRCAFSGLEPYIMIVSDTHQQACLHLQAIKTELE